MKRALAALLLLAATAFAEEPPNKLTISLDPLGDSDAGVVTRTTYKFAIPSSVPQGVPLVIIGSISQGGQVVKHFRYPLMPSQRDTLTAIQTLQPGDADIEARLMVPLEEQTPVIVAKNAAHFPRGVASRVDASRARPSASSWAERRYAPAARRRGRRAPRAPRPGASGSPSRALSPGP